MQFFKFLLSKFASCQRVVRLLSFSTILLEVKIFVEISVASTDLVVRNNLSLLKIQGFIKPSQRTE